MKFPTVSFLDFFNGLSLDFQGIDFVERGWCFVQIQHSKTSLGPLVEVATCSLFFNAISVFLRKAWSHFRTFHWSSWYFKQKIRLKNHLALLLLKKNTCQNPGISSIYLHFHYQPSNRFSNRWPKISPTRGRRPWPSFPTGVRRNLGTLGPVLLATWMVQVGPETPRNNGWNI